MEALSNLALIWAAVFVAVVCARLTRLTPVLFFLFFGFGMLGRAELAFVVMDIAYVQNNIIDTEAFYTLMFTAFSLNVMVPVTISLWKRVYSVNQTCEVLPAQPTEQDR